MVMKEFSKVTNGKKAAVLVEGLEMHFLEEDQLRRRPHCVMASPSHC